MTFADKILSTLQNFHVGSRQVISRPRMSSTAEAPAAQEAAFHDQASANSHASSTGSISRMRGRVRSLSQGSMDSVRSLHVHFADLRPGRDAAKARANARENAREAELAALDRTLQEKVPTFLAVRQTGIGRAVQWVPTTKGEHEVFLKSTSGGTPRVMVRFKHGQKRLKDRQKAKIIFKTLQACAKIEGRTRGERLREAGYKPLEKDYGRALRRIESERAGAPGSSHATQGQKSQRSVTFAADVLAHLDPDTPAGHVLTDIYTQHVELQAQLVRKVEQYQAASLLPVILDEAQQAGVIKHGRGSLSWSVTTPAEHSLRDFINRDFDYLNA